MFLATFIICLREGLEASLIVGILAAFLKRNGETLKWLVIAVLAAVAVSVGVGVALMLASQALPQAQQEAMETVIGAIAVVFVTTMILWMNKSARNMRKSLEADAQESLSAGGARAMAGMSFLAVVKEGFETAVFLLAVFQASSGGLGEGIAGSLVGLALAVFIGYGIYLGGSKFNISTFFKVTGPFLIAVAAGFVLNCFRTAHEAGWVNIGQQQVFDFSAVISNDSVVGALITGVFSIPADPRLIEVIAWFAYIVPVMVVYLWPSRWEFSDAFRVKFERIVAGVLVAVAVCFVAFSPRVDLTAGSTRTAQTPDGTDVAVTLVSVSGDEATLEADLPDGVQTVTLQKASDGSSHGIPLTQWEGKETIDVGDMPAEVSLNDLLSLNGGQLPKGISLERMKGPFQATWAETVDYSARTSSMGDSLLRASATYSLVATLTGGGIDGSKTVEVSGAIADGWSVSEDESTAAEDALEQAYLDYEESTLYWLWIPVALAGVAVGLLIAAGVGAKKAKEDAAKAA